MADFDPDKFIHETSQTPQSFDPDQFIADHSVAQKENPHDLVPFLKQQGSNIYNMGGDAASGLINAGLHPLDAAQNVANSIANPDIAGIYRTIRNIPVAGPAIDNIVSSGKALGALASTGSPEAGDQAEKSYKDQESAADILHAKEHPLTDFIQRSVGSLPFAPEQAGVLAADAFGKSLASGNDTWIAMKDARNALILAAGAVKAGHLVSSKIGEAVNAFPESVGVSPEAMQMVHEPNLPSSENVLPEQQLAAQQSPIKNFPTKGQLHFGNTDEMPDLPPQVDMPAPQSADDLSQQFNAGNNEGTIYAGLGQKAGGIVGGGLGGFAGHGVGAAIGVPVGIAVGKAVGGLIDTYGAPAVKIAMDAGIQLDKIADTPYIGVLMKAASEGSKSLAVTHYMLSQTDPNYQRLNDPNK